MLVPLPEGLSFDDGASLAVAGLTAGGLARVWQLKGASAVVWGSRRRRGSDVGGYPVRSRSQCHRHCQGKRVSGVLAAGGNHVIDRN
jgi:NADPH2:quinone reductase